MRISRRSLLSSLPMALVPGVVGSGMLGSRIARAATDEKRGLVVYVDWGWDPTYVFAPVFGSSWVDM